MKLSSLPAIIFLLVFTGCAHSPNQAASVSPSDTMHQPRPVLTVLTAPDSTPIAVKSSEALTESESEHTDRGNNGNNQTLIDVNKTTVATSDEMSDSSATRDKAAAEESDIEDNVPADETINQETTDISDPLEPFNRAMYHFNDKLYFWVLKPVAQGYSAVVPEVARIGVGNFFSNLGFPVRFVNCLLQANVKGAATEFGRFVMNTIWGIGGLLDPAASKKIALQKQEKDFGQTLGIYGLGPGFYITWPFLGPSSARDTVGLLGDFTLSPFTYLNPWELSTGLRIYDKVNGVSLKIGDYESLKGAAIDPYLAIRNAYVQYRLKKVKEKGLIRETPKPKGLSYLRGSESVPDWESSGLMAGH